MVRRLPATDRLLRRFRSRVHHGSWLSRTKGQSELAFFAIVRFAFHPVDGIGGDSIVLCEFVSQGPSLPVSPGLFMWANNVLHLDQRQAFDRVWGRPH